MAAQIGACGYNVTILQTTPGLFQGKFEIIQDGENIFLTLESSTGVRYIGKRNLKLTALTGFSKGTGGWRNYRTRHPFLAGFNLVETNCFFWAEPGSKIFAVLIPRDKLLERASPTVLDILEVANVAHCDAYRHSLWSQEAYRRIRRLPPKDDLLELTHSLLETSDPIVQALTTETQIKIIDTLPTLIKRIIAGDSVTVKQIADENFVSQSGYKNIIVEFTGMTPKQLVTLAKTEGVLAMLRDPMKRRVNSVSDSLVSIAEFYNWSEASARKNLRDLTGVLPSELLVLPVNEK